MDLIVTFSEYVVILFKVIGVGLGTVFVVTGLSALTRSWFGKE